MPSNRHVALRALFVNRPALAAELLRDVLGVTVPAYRQARCDSENITEVTSKEFRADAIAIFEGRRRPVFAAIVEPQLGVDPDKPYRWPQYGVCLRAQLKCPIVVLVVTPSSKVARWASQPIDIGPGSVFTPWVIGPGAIPKVTDPKQAASVPELAVLSAMAHGKGDVKTAVKIASAASRAVSRMRNTDNFVLYNDLIRNALGPAARKAFEMIPEGYQFKTPLIRKAIAKGVAEGLSKGRAEGLSKGLSKGLSEGLSKGQALSLLEILKARKLTVSAEQRKKILACRDRQQLATWLRRAVTVASVKELFTH